MRLALFLLLSSLLFACQQNNASAEVAAAAENTVAPASDSVLVLLNNQDFFNITQRTDALNLVDVRTPEEFAKGHIFKAVNIDFQDKTFEKKIGELSRQKPAAVYCASGIRSHKAAEKMEKMGFQKVYELQYGLRGWYRPLVSGDYKK